MTAVNGRNRQGTWTGLSIGDTLSGYTADKMLVTGTVIELVDHLPGVVIDGISVGGQAMRRATYEVAVKDVLTHVNGSPRRG